MKIKMPIKKLDFKSKTQLKNQSFKWMIRINRIKSKKKFLVIS